MRKHDEHAAQQERHEAAEREKQRAWDAQATPRSVVVRPYVVRCGVCLRTFGGVEAVEAVGLEILMPPHAVEPGYKCMGSGVAGVVLGRGDVIEGAVVPSRVEAPEVPGQWGTR